MTGMNSSSILKWIPWKQGVKMQKGFSWHKVFSGGFFLTWSQTLRLNRSMKFVEQISNVSCSKKMLPHGVTIISRPS
jgi:hypothetical protein